MNRHLPRWIIVILFATATETTARAQDASAPSGGGEPILRLQSGGPTSYVTSLAFSPDGTTLYAAGWDKTVHCWKRDAQARAFEYDPAGSFRVPVGPGLQGAINAIAISPDGTWLAAGGRFLMRNTAGFRDDGLVAEANGGLSDDMRLDEGTIYLFNTRTRKAARLRSQLGTVLTLAFAPQRAGKPPLLVCCAREWDAANEKYAGSVRLWRVDTASYLEGFFVLPGELALRPSIAAWHYGNAVRQLRIAVAYGEKSLLVWDVGRKRIGRAEDTLAKYTASASPDADTFVTGSGRQLQVWATSPGDAPPRRLDETIALPSNQFPGALAVFSSATGLTTAAALIDQTNRGRLNLALIDVARRRPRGATVQVWNDGGPQPSLVASADGRFLAVAGNRSHQIVVYQTADLIAGRDQPQRLANVGQRFQFAAVVRKDDQFGLLLRPSSVAGGKRDGFLPGDLILQLAEGVVVPNTAGWSISQPETAGWRAERAVANDGDGKPRVTLALHGPGGEIVRIRLRENEDVVEHVILPPNQRSQTPLIAVASSWRAQPWLYIYNAASGEQVSRLQGHTDRINSLSFSNDGRLLVSSGEDETVRVWSVLDIVRRHLGKRGQIPGLGVGESDGRLVVTNVSEDSPVRPDQIRKGDVILGIVENGRMRSLTNPTEFLNAIAGSSTTGYKPGDRVVLRRSRTNGAPVDVALPVGQSIDERKPLFSVFLSKNQEDQQVDWIGWSPIGPYESSRRRAERFIGWHFNTGNEAAPTLFALAEQYRKTYLRPGLLKDLAENGVYTQAAPPPPLPRPKMSLWLSEDGQEPIVADGQRRSVIRSRQATLNLSLYGIDSDKIDSVNWRVNQSDDRPMQQTEETWWKTGLSDSVSRRGPYDIDVTLRTNEAEPQEFTAHLTMRYQPPPPKVSTAISAQRVTVRESAFALPVEIQPRGDSAEHVKFTIVHQHGDKTIKSREMTIEQATKLSESLTLVPGDNYVEIIAENSSALTGFESLETSRVTRVVTYSPVVVDPPAVSLQAKLPASEASASEASQSAAAGEVFLVHVPKIEIEGRIQAGEEIAVAQWHMLGASPLRPLKGFQPNVDKRFVIRETIELTPGKQLLRVVAKTAHSVEVEQRLTVEYQPPLPRVAISAPHGGLTLFAGKDARTVDVAAELSMPEHVGAFDSKVLINGRTLPVVPTLSSDGTTLSARIDVNPGPNRIQIRLGNQWGGRELSDPVLVRYARPPRVVNIEHAVKGNTPFVDVTAELECWSDLPLTELRINGRSVPEDALERGKTKDDLTTWNVQIPNVPLERGDNLISLRAANRDGWCLAPGTVTVHYAPAPPAKAQVDVLEPQQNVAVVTPSFQPTLRVQSKTPLQSVEILSGDKVAFRAEQLGTLQKDTRDVFELLAKPIVPLERGVNTLTVRAVNAGGEQTDSFVVSYVFTPIRITIDKIESTDGADEPLLPTMLTNNRIEFDRPAREGTVVVTGHVTWFDKNDARLDEPAWLSVWINGFQQAPAPLQPRIGGSNERTFRARIVLNRESGNKIHFELPGLQQDVSNRMEFSIDCKAPVRDQRLHLLVVGPGERNRTKLAARAREALKVQAGPNGTETAPAFSQVRVYGPLVNFVSPQKVITQFERIRAAIRLGSRSSARNEVVMLFFQGKEAFEHAGFFYLLTSDSDYDKNYDRSAISSDDLERFFGRTPGAHVLLLDVLRGENKAVTRRLAASRNDDAWPAEFHVGLMRYAWKAKTDVPEDGRLVRVFGESLPNSETLDDVARKLDDRSVQLAKNSRGSLIHETFISDELRGLNLGAPR